MSSWIALVVGLCMGAQDNALPPVARAELPAELAAIARRYEIVVEVAKEPLKDVFKNYTVESAAPKKRDLEKYVPLFVSEWNRYPSAAIRKGKMVRIVLGAGLKMNGQVRAAVPAFESETMYYDVALGAHSPEYQRSVIHHELFHMLDQRQGRLWRDPEWVALNAPDFKYGDGGANLRTSGVSLFTDKIAGILTPYAASAQEEDKAELFAHLLVSRSYVMKRAETDRVLAKKIEVMKKRLAEWEPAFDEKFWTPSATSRDEGNGRTSHSGKHTPALPPHRHT